MNNYDFKAYNAPSAAPAVPTMRPNIAAMGCILELTEWDIMRRLATK